MGGCRLSADWPGFARRRVEKALDSVKCVMWLKPKLTTFAQNGSHSESDFSAFSSTRQHSRLSVMYWRWNWLAPLRLASSRKRSFDHRREESRFFIISLETEVIMLPSWMK